MTTHLVIGDSHARPGVSNRRFELLGHAILDIKPDVIVNIGDYCDMESLCSYDKGKKGFEGRRFKNDCRAVQEADKLLWLQVQEYNACRRRARYRTYDYRAILTLGNHEARISRACEASPELDGTLSIGDLGYDENWEVYPFLQPVEVDGIVYSHYFISGVMGRSISGEHPAYSLITKQFQSCVAGHIHTLDYCERTDATGKRIQALIAGCYLDIDQHENYAGEANKMWRRGIAVLHNVRDGNYDLEWISIERLIKMYGSRVSEYS